MKDFFFKFFTVLILLSIFLYVYGRFIESKSFKTYERKIEANITENFNGFKVVHISDIYYTTNNKNFFEEVIEEINKLKPDVVLFTGDLTTDELNDDEIKELTELLKKIDARIGKYTIKGDNDNYDNWNKIISHGGFTDLSDKSTLIFDDGTIPMIISGISSNSEYKEINEKIDKINNDINNLEVKPCYSILLLHEPDYIDSIDTNNYDLILAGHSLGGINLGIKRVNLPIGAQKYSYGKYNINNATLYVSNGIGTQKNEFRLLNTPSINFFRITK